MKTTYLPLLMTLLFWLTLAQTIQAQYVPKEKREEKKDSVQVNPPSTPETPPSPSVDKEPDKSPNPDRGSFWDRVRFGGNVGASFGDITSIELLPIVSYMVSDKFNAGIGINYLYFRIRYDVFNFNGQRSTFTYENSFYGGRVFGQYFVTPEIFAWAELESMNGNFLNRDTFTEERRWVTSPLVGAGYFQSFGGRGGVNFMLLYNLNYNASTSLYNSPWVTRVGFSF